MNSPVHTTRNRVMIYSTEENEEKSVTLGCMAKPEFEKSVKAYCEENQINLFRMERDKTLYRLLRVPVLQFED